MVLLFLANGHILYGYERISLNENQFDCYINEKKIFYMKFFRFYDSYIESISKVLFMFLSFKLSKHVIIPFGIMIICSCLIILQIIETRKTIRYNHQGKFYYYTFFYASDTIDQTVRKTFQEERKTRLRDKDIQLCSMLLGTTFAFLLLCLPTEINDLFLHTARERSCSNWFRKVILMILQQIYYAGHFYIYTLTGQLFRKHLYAVLFTRRNEQISTQRFYNRIPSQQTAKFSLTTTTTHRIPTTAHSNPKYGSFALSEPSQRLLSDGNILIGSS